MTMTGISCLSHAADTFRLTILHTSDVTGAFEQFNSEGEVCIEPFLTVNIFFKISRSFDISYEIHILFSKCQDHISACYFQTLILNLWF